VTIRQYLRFMIIGCVAAFVSLAVRELVAAGLGDSSALLYSISVLAAYAAGMIASYLLNRRYTFSAARGAATWSGFPKFVVVACFGMFATWALSLTLRYAFNLEPLFGRYAGTAAFVAAAVLSSLLTYPLNALLVFRQPARAAG
jgi:putative flippase GtrA